MQEDKDDEDERDLKLIQWDLHCMPERGRERESEREREGETGYRFLKYPIAEGFLVRKEYYLS